MPGLRHCIRYAYTPRLGETGACGSYLGTRFRMIRILYANSVDDGWCEIPVGNEVHLEAADAVRFKSGSSAHELEFIARTI